LDATGEPVPSTALNADASDSPQQVEAPDAAAATATTADTVTTNSDASAIESIEPAAEAAPTANVSTTGAAFAEAPAPAAPGNASLAGPPGSGLASGRPYVVIRFTESTVDYESALAEAVRRAVARRPNVAFDLVAVTPRASTADDMAEQADKARAQAAAIMKSLSALGIGPERVMMATWTGQPTEVNEIRLYIR
jgi:hypothetical protein